MTNDQQDARAGEDATHHGHKHEHEHDAIVIEDDVGNLLGQQMIDALQAVLVKRGILSAGEVTLEIQNLEAPGTHLGAKIVARAWIDQEFKKRLLANGKDGASELGIKVGEAQLVVLENDETVHNVIVCTLCSCYPRSILGQPPSWYVSKTYRARTVREPEKVLEEFGLRIPDSKKILVHDSNADMRYLILPKRPAGTEEMSEEQLSKLVSRDSMIGVALANGDS